MSKADELAAIQEQCQALMGEAGELEEFFGFVESAEATDALSTKTKELMSLAIGVVIKCEGCILWHLDGALRAGATHEEILDALKVAVVMGGGPGMMYAVEAYEALCELEKER
ncbi:MAG: carboxymuconolactone decarboxylase family protein [Halodesulfurarchaeum sp.]